MGALSHIRICDFTGQLAGAGATRVLAAFGAQVIRIEDPVTQGRWDILRDMEPFVDDRRGIEFGGGFQNHNVEKLGITLNLRTERGRELLADLVRVSDVVTENFAAGVLARLGFPYERLREIRDDVIYVSNCGFGHRGPYAAFKTWGPIVQSCCGLTFTSGLPDMPPAGWGYSYMDHHGGNIMAIAILCALVHRQRTGEGQHVDSALAYTAMTLQSPFMQLYEGKRWDEPRGQETLGSGPLHRAYQARDGWFFLGARTGDLPRLAKLDGLSEIASLEGATLERALEQHFRTQTVDHWVPRCIAAGLGAHRCILDLPELMQDPWVVEHELSATREHDDIGLVTTCGPAPRLSRTPVHIGKPAPKPGSDVRSILDEIGMADRLESLIARGVVRVDGVLAG